MTSRITALLVTLLSILGSLQALATPAPEMGRFLQRDPNGTAQNVLNYQTWYQGRPPIIGMSPSDIEVQYGNGGNLHEYLGSNPHLRFDPMGLSWDPFDMVDELAVEHIQSGMGVVSLANRFAWDRVRRIRAYERAGFAWNELIMDRDEAILYSMLLSPFFSSMCFEAGTPVIAADGSLQPIETLRLGMNVFSMDDGVSHQRASDRSTQPQRSEFIDPASWRQVDLHIDDPARGKIRVSLLRPIVWIQLTGAVPDGKIAIQLPEMELSGIASVVAIKPCPAIEKPVPGGECITGLFQTERSPIVHVWIKDVSKPIGTTANHPFFSHDRNCWVEASELAESEQLRSLGGVARVSKVLKTSVTAAVYNIEVRRTHSYFVGESQLWVHNACSVNQANKMIQRGKAPSSVTRVEKAAESAKSAADPLFDHVHFSDGSALYRNGTWRHGGRALSNAEIEFLRFIGWTVP